MSHSYSQNHLHVVFSTKERRKLITQQMQPKLWSYLGGIGRNHGFLILANGGIEDHVHLLLQLPPALALAKALLKSNSSKWMNEHAIKFAWQEGYGAFAVSASNLAAVAWGILNQPKTPPQKNFWKEIFFLLKKNKN